MLILTAESQAKVRGRIEVMATAKILQKSANPKARKPYTVRYWDERGQHERSFVTRREAADFKLKFEHDSRESIFVDPRNGSVPFGEYATAWIAQLPRASETTKQGYRASLALCGGLVNRKLRDVAQAREDVQALLVRIGETMSWSSANGVRVVIVGALNHAVITKRVGAHNCSRIPLKEPSVRASFRPVTRGHIEAMAAAMGDLGLTAYLQRYCGLRAGEALAVTRESFTQGGTVLRVTHQVMASGEHAPLKKRDSDGFRDIPVPAFLWAMVKALPPGPLFGDGHVKRGKFKGRFTRAVQAAGLPDGFTSHELRHNYASAMLANLVPISDVAHFLGHRDIRVTYKVYGHLVPSAFDRARAILDTEWQAA